MIASLLQTKRFLPLLLTQFLGAFNDNLFKNALMTFVAFTFVKEAGLYSNLIAGLFILPFFLFSALAGTVADKYSRDKIARVLKITEFILMFGAGAVFYFKSAPLLVVVLFLMGIQSAFFGPIKYALLPQLLKKSELVTGNAYIESSTYFSIILGSILGTLLSMWWAIGVLLICALIGYGTSRAIPIAPAPQPNLKLNAHILRQTADTFKLVRQDIVVFKSILGATWFWMLGVFFLTQIFPLCSQILNTTAGVITFFLVLFSVGVGLGSIACAKLLKGEVHVTFVPLSSLGMSICALVLFFLTHWYQTPAQVVPFLTFIFTEMGILTAVCLLVFSFFGGMYIVPLNTLIQTKAPKAVLASVIAGNNIINAFGMVLITLISAALLAVGFSIPQLFLIVGLSSFAVSFYICTLLPEQLIRSLLQTLLKGLFGVKINQLDNLKKAGKKALIIANHTSLLDGLLIASFMPRKITFAINTDWAKKWYVQLFGLLVDLFPLDPANPMAIRSLIEEVKKNKIVMIFPEGRISVTGSLMKIYEGAGLITYKTGAKLLPLRIDGAQYSKFSYMNGIMKTKFFPQITLTLLPPTNIQVPVFNTARQRRQYISNQLHDLMVLMMYKTSPLNENLFDDLLISAKRYGRNHIIAEDIKRRPMTYRSLIQKSHILGLTFKRLFLSEKIGLMLPNTLANLVSFFALQSIGKLPVMINFSQGVTQVLSSVSTVEVKTILTSRQFIEQARLEKLLEALQSNGLNVVFLEELATQIRLIEKIKGLWCAFIGKKIGTNAGQPAVVLFTSGSEGMPKAVLLSHRNLQANRYQIIHNIAVNPRDTLLNALPMFHSFGLTVGTILPVLSGVKVFFYPSPLHYRIIPEIAYDTNTTIICGTDTFLAGYGRMAHPYDFFNVRYAIVGGEKLKETTSQLWMKKFGVRILEGYGATETAPILSVNTPMYMRENTVGRLLTGIEYKLEELSGVAEGGKLLVKGDNIMLGYMYADKPGILSKLPHNWYDTGDIVEIDAEGFVHIKGRAKRFAKVAGEMISLTAVEQVIDKLYPNIVQGILTVPDVKKGEQLILITAAENATVQEIQSFMKEQGFSELWVPKKVIYLKKPPVLGTGKFDYQAAKALLTEME